jgi:hypothetical protein
MAVTDGIKVSPLLRLGCWVLVAATGFAVFKAFRLDPPLSWHWLFMVPLIVFFLYLFGYTAVVGHGPRWLVLTQRGKDSS